MKNIIQYLKKLKRFNSAKYWEKRYLNGGNSGAGSYEHLAQFKADIINELIRKYEISSIVEFGCGDGNQLSLLECQKYIGLDVSPKAIEICKNKFNDDSTKSFFTINNANISIHKSYASMSIDVLFHLTEEDVYLHYLDKLFSCSTNIVIIYAANLDFSQLSEHEIYRKFTPLIELKYPNWKLIEHIKNKYPAQSYEDQEGSLADFFVYIKNENINN